jgi:Sec-independent protein secretion pathway component TatC
MSSPSKTDPPLRFSEFLHRAHFRWWLLAAFAVASAFTTPRGGALAHIVVAVATFLVLGAAGMVCGFLVYRMEYRRRD